MKSSNGNIFRVTDPLRGEFTGHQWIPPTKASEAELWYIFYLLLNKLLSKQSWGWWFETPSCSLLCHCNEDVYNCYHHDDIIKWKHFPCYWPFVWGIHWSLVDSLKRPVTQSFDVFFDLCLNKHLSKQSRRQWFQTASHSSWHLQVFGDW